MGRRGCCARSRLACVVGSDARVRGDRRRRGGSGEDAVFSVERAHPRAALGVLDAAAAVVGRRPGKDGRRQHRPYGRDPAWAGRARPCVAGLVGSARRGRARVRNTPPFVPGAGRARTSVQPLLAAAGRDAGGGAAPTRGAGWRPHPRRARPGHEPSHPEGERVRVRARANATGRRVRHPPRTGFASGSAARRRPRARLTGASGTFCSEPCSRWPAPSPQRSLSGHCSAHASATRTKFRSCFLSGSRSVSSRCRR